MLQLERELHLRFGRCGEHAEVALQSHRYQRDGHNRRRPSLVAATADPQAIVIQPWIDELSAHPDRRNSGLRLKRRVVRRAPQDALRRPARMRAEERIGGRALAQKLAKSLRRLILHALTLLTQPPPNPIRRPKPPRAPAR